MRAAHNARRRVPQQLAVVGIDDTQFARVFSPSLTSVSLGRAGPWSRRPPGCCSTGWRPPRHLRAPSGSNPVWWCASRAPPLATGSAHDRSRRGRRLGQHGRRGPYHAAAQTGRDAAGARGSSAAAAGRARTRPSAPPAPGVRTPRWSARSARTATATRCSPTSARTASTSPGSAGSRTTPPASRSSPSTPTRRTPSSWRPAPTPPCELSDADRADDRQRPMSSSRSWRSRKRWSPTPLGPGGTGARFVLNAAPAAALIPALLTAGRRARRQRARGGRDRAGVADVDDAVRRLLEDVPAVLVTLGSQGARLVDPGRRRTSGSSRPGSRPPTPWRPATRSAASTPPRSRKVSTSGYASNGPAPQRRSRYSGRVRRRPSRPSRRSTSRPGRSTAGRMADDFDPLVPRPLDLPRRGAAEPGRGPRRSSTAARSSRRPTTRPTGRVGANSSSAGGPRPASGWHSTTRSTTDRTSRGRRAATSSARCGCGTSCSTTGRRSGSRPNGCWPTRGSGSAGSTEWCCGTHTPSSASTTGTSGTSTATSTASPSSLPTCTRPGSRCSSTTTRGTPAPGGPATTRPSWPRWSPSSRSTGSSSTPSRRVGPSCSTGWPRPVPGWRSRASRLCRSSGSPTIRCRGRSGSPTPRRPAWCAPTGSSGGTRCTTSRRWHRDHAEELQSAWLNGIGVMVWEVVFGVWVGWSDRDAQTLRRMSRTQRALHRPVRRRRLDPSGRPR